MKFLFGFLLWKTRIMMAVKNLGLVKTWLPLANGYYKTHRQNQTETTIKSRCLVIFRVSCKSSCQNRVGVNSKHVKVLLQKFILSRKFKDDFQENTNNQENASTILSFPLPSFPSFFLLCFISIEFVLFHLCIYLFMAALGLRCCTRAFSSCGERGYSLLWFAGFSWRWLLLLQSMGCRCAGFSSCGAWAQ